MKTSTFEKGIPMLRRLGLCLPVLLGALALSGGCYSEGAEGDRCDPLRSSDECNSGLHCSGNPIGISAAYPIAFCPENYCCPATVTASDNPYCQPGCNGGAAAICSDDPMNAAACAFASCAGDAANPETCPQDAGESTDAGVSEDGATGDGATGDVASDALGDVVTGDSTMSDGPTGDGPTGDDGTTGDGPTGDGATGDAATASDAAEGG
jgi:hypothetical protein